MGGYDAAAAALDAAVATLDAVLEGADADHEARSLRARVLVTRAWAELELHGTAAALDVLATARAEAEELGDALVLALTWIQEGLVHGRVWDYPASLAALDRVSDEEALAPAQRWALHLNRGQVLLGLGRTDEGVVATRTALDIAVDHGLVDQEFKARHNLARLAWVLGDLPRALVLLREVDAMDTTVSRDRARLDYAEVLTDAGLVDAARRVLADALVGARADGHRLEEGEISLRLARCHLMLGDLDAARSDIDDAAEAYRSRQAGGLVRDADLLRLTVDVAAGRDLAAAAEALDRLRTSHSENAPARRDAARLEAEARAVLGDLDRAEAVLDGVPAVDGEPLSARLHETLVRARVDDGRHRPGAAAARLALGSRLLAGRQFQTSSLEVRAALALHARRLTAFDLERAVRGGDPSDLLTTVERWRAISHRVDPVTAAADAGLTDLTRELRRLRRVAEDGGPDADDAPARTAALEARIAEREWSLEARRSDEPGAAPLGEDEARDVVAARDVTVLELVEVGAEVLAVVVTATSVATRGVGPLADVLALTTRLRRDLRARAGVVPTSPMRAVLDRATASSLRAVEQAVGPLPGTGRVVVVPSRSLSAVPWNLLPGWRGRPVTVSPSLTRWVRGPARELTRPADPAPGVPPRTARTRDGRARKARTLTALHGPGLAHTLPEIREVRRAWGADEATGPAGPAAPEDPATSDDVVAALASSRVVHLAAHGVHERDNPLFSSVRMADGPVFAREFPHPVTAEHVALAACDVGQFSTRPGDEPLGLATALLALGSTSVLAAVAPVADDRAAAGMADYHRALAAGVDAAEALATTVEAHPETGAFCLYGSDWSAAR
ncbi:CHAT domain-containing protein [Phycicoccus sp. BSK3Z-2]|uniref:CHAT domain-containing protein n=1 Tax=Phycicoccus avicenniae TaxID=2828860 RepID=A0A941DC40_9MICO|nr:CHAT domain-containing protein [Phycicoccus avicenniae]MBR7744933.1 CHAT domain-containing protein [Phycicoccus avicenniae]